MTLAAVVERHAAAADLALRVTPSRPLDVRLELQSGFHENVAIVIASRCRDPVSLSCIRAILDRTTGGRFEIVLVVAQSAPPDTEQKDFIAALGDTDRVRVLHVPMAQFNYAVANNAGVAATTSPLVLLLNDDVAPCRADWLSVMVAHMRDERVGVVGAKLLYPDRTVQHAGVIMGLDGVAEHAGRLLGRDSPGPSGLFTLDREVSAVTGACMLTRRRVFDALDGLDESFARAFNDVDYCLRARAFGWGVVLSARSPLIHHESLSFGSHYEGAESSRNLADEERMRARWSAWIENDPFHSPNLALFRIADTEPAFPPRVDRLFELSMESELVRAQPSDRSCERPLQPATARTEATA
jgi:GT2 family glycosyltransferase